MGLSKSTRIMILLGIDSAFFLLELVVGYAVHSLALVADSFHMVLHLNYVLGGGVVNSSAAERCHITPCRTLGSEGREREDQFQEIHIWGEQKIIAEAGVVLTPYSGNALKPLVLS
jgi:hypothetical protein